MQKAKEPYLSTSNLAVGFRHGRVEKRLFEDLNLHLLPGELVCFMGPNGIGKSSLIRTIAGLQMQLDGYVNIRGSAAEEDRSREIAVVLTDRITSANMTVAEIISFGRYPYLNWNISLREEDRQIVNRAIAQVRIGHLTEEKMYALSDGQVQMVMIARALAQDTPVLLLDEPTAHLDLNNRVEIMSLLKSLAAQTRKAILVATHELDLALQMADRIWLTGRRKNIHTGIPEDLVLRGSFDEIFEFKGFDLKTGRVQHAPVQGVSVTLDGVGHEYLWTKNALERKGYHVVEQGGAMAISVQQSHEGPEWRVSRDGDRGVFHSIADLIDSL